MKNNIEGEKSRNIVKEVAKKLVRPFTIITLLTTGGALASSCAGRTVNNYFTTPPITTAASAGTPEAKPTPTAHIEKRYDNFPYKEFKAGELISAWGPSLIVGDFKAVDNDENKGQILILNEGEEIINQKADNRIAVIWGFGREDLQGVLDFQMKEMFEKGGKGPQNPPTKIYIQNKNFEVKKTITRGAKNNAAQTQDAQPTPAANQALTEKYPGLNSGIYSPNPEYDINDNRTFKFNSQTKLYELIDIKTNQPIAIKNYMTLSPIDVKKTDYKVDVTQQLYYEIGPDEAAIVQGRFVDGKIDALTIQTRRSKGNNSKVKYYPKVYQGSVIIVPIVQVAEWATYLANQAISNGRPYKFVHEIRDNIAY